MLYLQHIYYSVLLLLFRSLLNNFSINTIDGKICVCKSIFIINLFPLFFGTTIVDVQVFCNPIERLNADGGHARRDRDARKTLAVIERKLANARRARRDGDGRDIAALTKCPMTNRSHTIANCHIRQFCAARECTLTDRSHSIRYSNRSQVFAILVRFLWYISQLLHKRNVS